MLFIRGKTSREPLTAPPLPPRTSAAVAAERSQLRGKVDRLGEAVDRFKGTREALDEMTERVKGKR